jgi:hypothetical protein
LSVVASLPRRPNNRGIGGQPSAAHALEAFLPCSLATGFRSGACGFNVVWFVNVGCEPQSKRK